MTPKEWRELTGGGVRDQVAGLESISQVGDASNQGFGVAFGQVVELNGRISTLDTDVKAFHTPDAKNPDDLARVAGLSARELSFKMRWSSFLITWNTWQTAHQSSFSRISGSTAVEFGALQAQYNGFLAEFLSIGGVTSVKPAITEDQRTSPLLDRSLQFLGEVKWLLALGVAGYILVETGAARAVGNAFDSRRTAR